MLVRLLLEPRVKKDEKMDITSSDVPVQEVRLSDIAIGQRLREVDPDKVRAIAESISRMDLLYPVILWRDPQGILRLVAGWHRLEAFRLLGRDTIPAKIKNYATAGEARIGEIDDNLCRRDLTVLETVIQLKIREELLAQEGKRATGGFPLARSGETKVTTAELARVVNMPERRYQNYLQISRGIPPQLIRDVILGSPLANHLTALLELCRVEDGKIQHAAILRAARLEDVSTAKVLRIITEETDRLKPGTEHKPLSHSLDVKAAERLFIERLAKIVSRAAMKMRSAAPEHAEALATAKGMLDQLRLVLEAAGVDIGAEEPGYVGAFLGPDEPPATKPETSFGKISRVPEHGKA